MSKTVPGANGSTIITANAYDGATTRVLSSTCTAGGLPPQTTTFLHDDCGEQVGAVLDGITNRTDLSYETDASNVVWRVETSTVVGPSINSISVTRTRLTGLSDSCRRQVVTFTGATGASPVAGLRTETTAVCDSTTGIVTETVTSSAAGRVVRQSRHGVLLSEATGMTTYNSYDALGRLAATSRGIGGAGVVPVQDFAYSPAGDLVAQSTYTNATDVVTETYAYDQLGNRVTTTDALGNAVHKAYDPLGNVTAEWGATYPVRYEYDTQSRRTALATTRDGETWDTTRWTYDAATGSCTAKTYADGSTVRDTYTPDNLPLRTTYASGRWKEYAYDAHALSDGGLVAGK